MLDTLSNQDNAIFYTAIEDGEDVSHSTVSGEAAEKYYEEDKNYSPDHKFTVFSPEVKNTLVSFFDLYVNTWKSSQEVSLGFYTTASIGKEKKSFNVDATEAAPPAEPILLSLSAKADNLSNAIAMMVKSVLVEEYQKQYSSKSSDGYSKTLETMPIKDFKLFLSKITWHFGDEDEVALKRTVMQLICDSRFHNVRLAGKEESVFCILMEMLDERQHKQSLASRVVSASDVELVFKKAESEEDDSLMDPTWSEYRKLEEQITDKRNLEDKVLAVCPEYSPKKLQFLARLACRAKSEQLASNRSFLSLKYRIYEACTEHLLKEVESTDSEGGMDEAFEHLKSLSSEHINELKSDYKYTVSNKHTVSGIVMDLFDGCFMSFDELSNEE